MENIIYHPDSDLWKGEQSIFADLVQSVPDDGVIVEIGTSKGGTTALIHAATKGRKIAIYTVDIAPQAKTYENLKDTDVNIIVQPSAEAAGNWRTMSGGGKLICCLLTAIMNLNMFLRILICGYPISDQKGWLYFMIMIRLNAEGLFISE